MTRIIDIQRKVRKVQTIAVRSGIFQTAYSTSSSTCPITGSSSAKIGPSTDPTNSPRPYAEIPGPKIYPILGSLLDFKEHGATLFQTSRVYYKKYGMITKQNIKGDEIIIYDPREHLKVFRAEGKYPIAPVSDFWPFVKYGKTHKMSDLLTVGEKWKNVRVKLQADILSPQAAASYLPSLTLVGSQASDAFAFMGSNPHDLTSRVSFDMFGITMLGKSPGVLFPDTAAKEDVEFIRDSITSMRTAGLMVLSPYESFMQKYFDTKLYKEFEKATDNVNRRSEHLVREAMTMGADDDSLDGGSYLQRLMRTGSMTEQQAGFEVTGLLLAAVDTTANYMNWVIYNLAANPDKQTLLAEELKAVLKGGDYNKEVELPYLQACYRETHRHTPLLTNVFRKLEEDIVLEGFLIPADTQLTMNTDAVQRDPQYVQDADVFMPERWLSAAVEARKGTPSELIDHRLLAGPFSFGPRMCLGARLAELEIKVFISRIVQDWEFSLDPQSTKVEVKEMLFMSPFPEFRLVFKRR